jgi:predicted HAD superfamily phosphohydrolase YqeG
LTINDVQRVTFAALLDDDNFCVVVGDKLSADMTTGSSVKIVSVLEGSIRNNFLVPDVAEVI